MSQASLFGTPDEAVFSPDKLYRYRLTRELGGTRTVVWCCLNPSTATGETDDPTVRKMKGFTTDWGFGRLVLVNLFAWRSTDPKALRDLADPVGPHNDDYTVRAAREADLFVCAWGDVDAVRKLVIPRAAKVIGALRGAGVVPHVLALTDQGRPRHPLYMLGDTEPVVWAP